MNFAAQSCQILGHDNFKVSHICTYQQCTFEYKLLCLMCFNGKSHRHQQKNFNHILEIPNNKEIGLNNQLQLILQQTQCEQMNKNKIFKLSLYFKYTSLSDILLMQISQNNHLAFGGNSEKIYLINLENNSLHDLRLKDNLQQFKFSSDSKYLFLTDQHCRFYQYNLNSKKLVYVRKISQFQRIKYIIPINNSNVICSSSNAIFVVNLKQRKQNSRFRMKNLQIYPKLYVNALAYDNERDCLIISSWISNTITILNRQSKDIVIQEKIQINLQLKQLLQSDDILYICGRKQIIKYQIDYDNKKIHYLCKFNDASYEKISYFNFIRSIDTIILVNEEKVLILDINLEIIQTFLHTTQIDLPDNYLQIQDLYLSNYLIIPSLRQLMVFKIDSDLQKDNQE
ncbi:hypothetical protein pb186bvf_015551 [Paramecium bursaria]